MDGKLWQFLGIACLHLVQLQAADNALRRAAELLPNDDEIRQQLALARRRLAAQVHVSVNEAVKAGRLAAALRLARRALDLDPDDASHHNNLAVVQSGLGQLADAIDSCREAVRRAPGSFLFQRNLAALLTVHGQKDAALEAYRRAFEIDPDDHDTRMELARAVALQGRLREAAHYCRGGRDSPPDDLQSYSSLLFYLSLDETVSAQDCFAAHEEFGRRVDALWPVAGTPRHPHEPDPDRRLRVGFVSADLREHPVAGFIEPVWAAVDAKQLEVWVYSNHGQADDSTHRLRRLASQWVEVADMSDAELVSRIREDRIDILFDLSGHTGGHRLLAFAHRPAPIQVTWIGYPNTTGLQAMDYALCDRFNAPPGLYEQFYVEKFARIPCSGTFNAPVDLPPVGPLPALAVGRVTFGSFNRIGKQGPAVLQAWARVLRALPDAQLLIGQVHDEALAARLRDDFARLGVEPGRLRLRPPLPLQDYLALHDQVDIVLDTWPYTGGTTTNYALAMGVPVVTLQGPGRAHCQSAGVLGRIGLGDWVARDVDEFVAIAVARAADLPALAALRAGLRDRWQHTPLRQPANVARGLEAAVRAMWQRWCAGLPAEHVEVQPQGDGWSVRWGGS